MIAAARSITETDLKKNANAISKLSSVSVKLAKENAQFLDNEDVANQQVDCKKLLQERFGSRLKTLESMFNHKHHGDLEDHPLRKSKDLFDSRDSLPKAKKKVRRNTEMESDEDLFDAKSEKSKDASGKQPVVSEDEEDLF